MSISSATTVESFV